MRRKQVIFPLIVLMASVFLFNCGVNKDKRNPVSLKSAIDEIVNPRLKVGAIVGVIIGKKRYVFSYGTKKINGSEAPDIDTVFEIGSNTKTFTTIMLADMHLKGKVNLTDGARKYLPGEKVTLPRSNGTEITLLHLATHTSGIPSMPDNIALSRQDAGNPFADYSVSDMYDFLNRCTLEFPVGTKHQYSNTGVGLLGLCLSLAEKMSYNELLHRRLLTPLGMENTSLFLTEKQKANLATGHDGNLKPVSVWTATDCLQGAGFIKSNLKDMFIYLEANMELKKGPLLDAIRLSHRKRGSAPWGEDIGLGWYIAYLPDGQTVINHNGATSGYYAYIGFNKKLGNGVIVLCNNKYSKASDEIGLEILKVLNKY
jgi:serine-type D-Ala-D-Ala carboxypeptidase/endopeptidase